MSGMNTLHTLCTCVSLSWVQTISSSIVKTLKCCVMLSSAVFLTSCTSWASVQNRVLDRVSLSGSNEPWSLFLSPVHSSSSTGPLNTHLVSFDTTNTTNTADPKPEPKLQTRDDGNCWTRASKSQPVAEYSCLESTFQANYFFFNLK